MEAGNVAAEVRCRAGFRREGSASDTDLPDMCSAGLICDARTSARSRLGLPEGAGRDAEDSRSEDEVVVRALPAGLSWNESRRRRWPARPWFAWPRSRSSLVARFRLLRRERFAAADLVLILQTERAQHLSRPLNRKLSDFGEHFLFRMERIKVRERELRKLLGLGFCRAAGARSRALDRASVCRRTRNDPYVEPIVPRHRDHADDEATPSQAIGRSGAYKGTHATVVSRFIPVDQTSRWRLGVASSSA